MMDMRLTIDGITGEYEVFGHGPNFLILHGWSVGIPVGINWERIVQSLSQYFRVWLIHLPGFGKSEMPTETWGVEEYSRFVEQFIYSKNISEIILLGHSFGGRIAIHLASQNPLWLKKLVLVSAAGIRRKAKPLARLIQISAKVMRVLLEFLPRNLRLKIEENLFKSLAKLGIEYAQNPKMRHIFKRVVEKDLTPALEKISVPTLIVWGGNDQIVPVEDAKIMHEKIKNSQLTILPGVGHFPFLERESEFLRIIQIFLQEDKNNY